MMWYVTDKDQHMDPRCFGDLSLLIKTLIHDDDKMVIEYINKQVDPDAYIFDEVTLPYIGPHIALGELTVAYAKYNGKWDELIWQIADEIEESVLDCFEEMQPGDTEIVYVGNYAITHD